MVGPSFKSIARRSPWGRDHIVGCLVGGALGDLCGGISERGAAGLSDDTQLTLATCEAITDGQVSPERIAQALLRWYVAGDISGLGSATLKALRDLSAGAHWAMSGARGEMAAGNGAAMRIAPLAFVLDPLDPAARVTIRDVARITHHSDEAYLGALAVLLAIHYPCWPPGESFFGDIAQQLPDCRVRDRLREMGHVSLDSPIREVAKRYGAGGYVVESVPLALWFACRMSADCLHAAFEEFATLEGDADTIGSIAGQIAGAHLGRNALPDALALQPPIAWAEKRASQFSTDLSESY